MLEFILQHWELTRAQQLAAVEFVSAAAQGRGYASFSASRAYLVAFAFHADCRSTRTKRQRRETVEHPFGTMKARMGATHFLTKTLPKVAAEMALSVLAYNLTRVMNIVGIKPLIAAIAA